MTAEHYLSMLKNTICTALIAGLSLILVGCATNPVTGKQDFVLMSEDQEIEIGRKYHQQLLQTYRVYDNPELQDYVSELVENIATKSHRDHLIFHSTVLDTPQVNAFALPGGYVYVTRGIMAYMNSEAELAGVLGHEIGHVTARHGVRQQSASQITGIITSVIGGAAGVRGAGDLANVAGTALLRGYGREHELEADRLGAEYLAKSGYDPREMIKVIGILKSQEQFDKQLAAEEGREPRAYHGIFSTHPDNDSRLQEVIMAANKYETDYKKDNQRFFKMIDGLVLGNSEDEGVVRNNRFYHKQLGITIAFPDNWKIDNLPDRLLASTKSKDAVIQISLRDLNKRQTPEQFLRDQFKQELTAGKAIQTDTYPGYTAIVEANTPFGRRATRVAAVFQDNQVYQIFAVTQNDGDLKKYDGNFLHTINSIRSLKPSEVALAEARTIKIITAKNGDTFAKLAAQSPLTSHAEEQLRLLNGLYPDGEPVPGQPIKVVQ
tara:strand:+ start:144 stop:1619 length:1476 start_codon:yes stop_codon:yes gene_type:complete